MTWEYYHQVLFDEKICEKSGCDKNNVKSAENLGFKVADDGKICTYSQKR